MTATDIVGKLFLVLVIIFVIFGYISYRANERDKVKKAKAEGDTYEKNSIKGDAAIGFLILILFIIAGAIALILNWLFGGGEYPF